MTKTERRSLAAALNSLLAAPTFANWRQGTALDIGEWLAPNEVDPIVQTRSEAA
jgi:hypothetical protein